MGIILLSLLHILEAVVLFLAGLGLVAVAEFSRRHEFSIPHHFQGLLPLIGGALIAFALLCLVLAYGLWTGRRWAWIISIILSILVLIASILSLIRGGLGAVVTLVLDAIILYYLTRPRVRAFFHEESAPSTQPTTTVPQQVSSSAAPVTGMNCLNCGAPLTSGVKFCSHCGAQVQ